MTTPTFITGNPNKAKYLAEWLGIEVPHHKLDLDEIQSLDLRKVVEHKVRQAYGILGAPVLVEDAALELTAMGRLPGTFIKWFLEELGVDGLARLAASLSSQSATGHLMYALYDGAAMHIFEGEMHGQIASVPRGNGGFGFDKIFVNDGYDITRAEMTEAQYKETSYRYQAMQKLKEFMNE